MNRTGVALLDARKRCNELLSEWGRHFPFLLIHGGADKLCPRSACDSLIAASPQMDKQLTETASLHIPPPHPQTLSEAARNPRPPFLRERLRGRLLVTKLY